VRTKSSKLFDVVICFGVKFFFEYFDQLSTCSFLGVQMIILEEGYVLSRILDYLGFCPGRYYLREANRFLSEAVDPVVELNGKEFTKALYLKAVNTKWFRCKNTEEDITRGVESLLDWHKTDGFVIEQIESMLGLVLPNWRIFNYTVNRTYEVATEYKKTELIMRARTLSLEHETFREFSSDFERRTFLGAVIQNHDVHFLKRVLSEGGLDRYGFEILIAEAVQYKSHKCLKVLERLGGLRWFEVDYVVRMIALAKDHQRLKVFLKRGNISSDECVSAWLNAFVDNDSKTLRILSRFMERAFGRLRDNPILQNELFNMCLSIGSMDRSDERKVDEQALFWVVNHLVPGKLISVLDSFARQNFRSVCEYLVSKGALLFDFPGLVGHVETVEELEFFSNLLGIRFQDFHLRDFKSLRSIDTLEFLIHKGVSLAPNGPCYENPVIAICVNTYDSEIPNHKKPIMFANPKSLELLRVLLDNDHGFAWNLKSGVSATDWLLSLEIVTDIWTGRTYLMKRDFDKEVPVLESSEDLTFESEKLHEEEMSGIQAMVDIIERTRLEHPFKFAPDALVQFCYPSGNLPIRGMKFLLSNGADVNAVYQKDGRIFTALLVFMQRDYDLVKIGFLLQQGAQIQGETFPSALTIAANEEYEMDEAMAALKLLIEYKGDVNWKGLSDDGKQCTPLHEAACNDKFEIVKLMIENGADPNMTIEPGNVTPLQATFIYVDEETYQIGDLLLEAKADINARNSDGRTMLFSMVMVGNLEAVEWLLSRGADPLIPDTNGISPMNLARFCLMKDLNANGARTIEVRNFQATAYEPLEFDHPRDYLGIIDALEEVCGTKHEPFEITTEFFESKFGVTWIHETDEEDSPGASENGGESSVEIT
jgi:ankyrin repeat protein